MNFSESPYTDRDLLEFLGQQESQDIFWGDHFEEELVENLRGGQSPTGARLPWPCTHDRIRFRPGEVSILAGVNGHKKSMLLGQILEWIALKDGEPVGVMSFEMPIRDTQARMCRQAAGSKSPAESFARAWSRWNHGKLCYYDKLDTTPSNRVLGAIYYMAKDLGCKHIMIDSLTKCGLPYGERGAEKDFIDALCATAKVFQIHIYLVCHVRKPQGGGEDYVPTKFDIRGAGELTDLVHNVMICWADKRKQKIQQMAERFGDQALSEKDREHLEKPDHRLVIAKQRNGEFEGTIGLWFHESLQFTEYDGRLLPFEFPRVERVA